MATSGSTIWNSLVTTVATPLKRRGRLVPHMPFSSLSTLIHVSWALSFSIHEIGAGSSPMYKERLYLVTKNLIKGLIKSAYPFKWVINQLLSIASVHLNFTEWSYAPPVTSNEDTVYPFIFLLGSVLNEI